jgi:hypothetical protein
MKSVLWTGWLLAALNGALAAETTPRSLPKPLSQHPGNVFLAGENVVLPVPPKPAAPWRLLDYDDKEITAVTASNGRVSLGALPAGFYRLRYGAESNWVSLAVLAPLKTPIPLTSPIAIDVAMSWFYPKEKMEAAANLCALAGINWVRDRLSWSEMEGRKGEYAQPNRYDAAALAQTEAGLRVLQVNHTSPGWAAKAGHRFPPDLRDAYGFYREMARRWRGPIEAFEPWNEADISQFGGHTGSEMAAMQKASFLGLKAGNPDVIACLNVFAMHNRAQLEDLRENEAWPYFDTFNLHHYAPFDEYPKLYADFRAVSAGKPLWVSECAVPVKWAGDAQLKEPSAADLRVQAERVAKTFACSLHEGSVATFYFLLPHYVEGQTQFGLLRPDLTPRPAYVALAAAGRLLAGAKPLGRLKAASATTRAFLFQAQPDGQDREVLVVWTTQGKTPLPLPVAPSAVFDHLGRSRPSTNSLETSPAPLFALLSEGSHTQFQLDPPPKAPERLTGSPSPVVLQTFWPEDRIVLSKSAYRLSPDGSESVPLFAYNFGNKPVSGQLRVIVPEGWRVKDLGSVEIASQSRAELKLELDCRAAALKRFTETVRVTGDFGPAGQPVCSMRVMLDPQALTRKPGTPIPEADNPARWQAMTSGNGATKVSGRDGAVLIEAEPTGSDRWVYPRLTLPANRRPESGCQALCCTLTLLEGEGQFQAIFDEENGSSYVVAMPAKPKRGETVEALALLENATHGAGWSKPDPDQHLDFDQIISLKIGCNTKAGRVAFTIRNLRWVKF